MKILRVILVFCLMSSGHFSYAQQCEHIVQRGENFESIASKYGVTIEELKKANGESASCYVGRKLQIPYHGVEVERKSVEVEPYDYKLTSSNKNVLTKSAATTYQVGYANWKKGKFDIAYLYLLSAAEKGETRAYYPLGDCYSQKTVVGYDEQAAAQWFVKAVAEIKDKSDENYWLASLRLADAYVHAKGVGKDVAQARYYYNKYNRHVIGKHSTLAVAVLSSLRKEETAIAKAEKERANQERRRKEEAYLAEARNNAIQNSSTRTTGGNLPSQVIVPQGARTSYNGAYTVETTGYWGHKQTLYVQPNDFHRVLNPTQRLVLYFSSKNCSVITVNIVYQVQTSPMAWNNPFVANMLNVVNGWSVCVLPSKGFMPGAFGIKGYAYDNGYFVFCSNTGITYRLAQDFSSFMIGATKYDYRISKEQYEELRQIETDFLNKVDAYEARIYSGSSDNGSSGISKSLQEAIEECDHNINAINKKSVERYTKKSSTKSPRGIYYAPDYTGGKYAYWCSECQKWGPQHVHFNLK